MCVPAALFQALAWSRALVPGVQVVRPLMGVSRQQTADFCSQHELKIWEDCTNSDNSCVPVEGGAMVGGVHGRGGGGKMHLHCACCGR